MTSLSSACITYIRDVLAGQMAFLSNILFHYNLRDNTNNNAIVVCVQNEDFKSPRFNVHKMVCLIRLRPTVGGNKTQV